MLKGGRTGLSESTLVKIPHCRKSHVTAHIYRGYMFILPNRDVSHKLKGLSLIFSGSAVVQW